MILKTQNEREIYSDGGHVEEEMLKIAQQYPEDLSQDFIADNSCYTVNNTFSAVRQNILNWYPFEKNSDILEVGAGMGSITGMLCDKGRTVTALEMSEKRADVIRSRYPNRSNLEIISADLTEWKTDKKYDYVVFIGVLEYAGVFLQCTNPYEYFLQCAINLLKPNGVILFAIENRFGLKYWIGGSEDHLQKPFLGIEGYKEPKTAQTFSRNGIEKLLNKTGLTKHRIYSVYPDYKFPEIICSDEFAPNIDSLQKVSFTYSRNSELIADEKELYPEIIDNNVWQFFANSFLVEASLTNLSEPHVVHVSAKGEVKKQYRTSTVIWDDGKVEKIPMHKESIMHIENQYRYYENLKNKGVRIIDTCKENYRLVTEYQKKESAQKRFVSALENNNKNELFYLIDELKECLLKSSDLTESNNIMFSINSIDRKTDYGPILANGYVDMTFYNAFIDDQGLLFYDQEWMMKNVPLNFILYYAVKSSYNRANVKTNITIKELCDYIGVTSEKEDYDKLEEFIWGSVLYRQTDFYGEDGYCNRYNENNTLQYQLNENSKKIHELNIKLDKKNEEYKNICQECHKLDQELEEKEKNIEECKRIILNKTGHIEQLLEQERAYMNLLNTKGVRSLRKWWAFKEKLFPQGSKRKLFAKLLKKFLRHPIYMLKKCTPARIKRTLHYMRIEDPEAIGNRLEAATLNAGQNIERAKLDLIPLNQNICSIDDVEKLILPKCEKPLVSIIIPVYNQIHYTYNCLKSIIENSGDIAYEVIIGDDCSTDLTKDIKDFVENIYVSKTPENLRFLRNCNLAAKQARGKYILFLNNDTQVQKKWLSSLVDLIERDEKIGMVGSKLLYPDGTLQEAGGIIWENGNAWNYGNGQSPNKPEFNYVKEVDYISGAAIMIRAELWKEIGGFDELFSPAYCEDSDLAFEVRKRGYKLMYQPASVVVHFEGKSNGTDLSTGVKKYQIENSEKLKKKWAAEYKKQSKTEADVFHARERSQRKLTILVVDHYVPQFDKDAGSKTTWQYLKMFVKQGYNVKFMGDNFYQDNEYTPLLEQMGIEVLYGSWYAQNYKKWIIENQDNIDFAYLNRPHITEKYIDFIKQETNIKVIYYGHDLHFLRIKREYELNHDEKLLKESQEWYKKELAIMRKADVNYYPSNVEVDEIHRIDETIPVKAITAYVYEQFRENVNLDFTQKEGIVFVGGFGHPPNEDAVLWFANEIYPLIKQKQDIPFYIVGSKVTEKVQKLNGDGIIVKGFVTEEELQTLYDTCKIVVVPLRYGAGVKGKVVEALYYGTPMVSTTTGIEGIQGAEEFMEVTDDPKEFADKVVALYNDNDRLGKIVEDYQNYVKEHFSTEAVWNIIKEDFNGEKKK